MKKILCWAYAALLIVYLLPVAFREAPASTGEGISPAKAHPLVLSAGEERPADDQAPTQAPVPGAPVPERLRVLVGDEVVEMDTQDYLTGVVAGEMPASFPHDALKAQAVAARTYAMYCAAAHKHGEADLCTDPGCCQAWLGEDRLREKWGRDYETRLGAVRDAVEETAGEYLSYQGEPVFAAFHSSSAGATEDCGAVWSPLPYLVSVSSPETAGDVPGYISTLRCAPIDFRDVILSAHPEADFSGEAASWIGELRRDPSGRVESLVLGGTEISGAELRSLFSLRSTAFTLEYSEGSFLFTVTGYGHGVGMSQYGAMVLARDGADYASILAHYYPGTVLVQG